MESRKSLIVSLVVGVLACSSFHISQAIADPDTANRAVEINRKLDEYATQHAITGKDLARSKIHVMTIAATQERINLDSPIPKVADNSSEFLGETFVTSRALAYQTGLPRYQEVKRYIRDNSFTLLSDQVDRRITKLENSCTGCMDPDRLTTPIRIEYIPVGTSIKVMGEYLHKSDSLFGSDIRMLIVRDEQGNSAEVSELSFELDIANTYTGRESRKITAVLNNIESFNNNDKLRLSFCPSSFVNNSPDPAKFIRDFQMDTEVDITASDAVCDDGYIFEFKTLESYLTSNYYFNEWGLYGKWSLRLTKPKPPAPRTMPTISACSIPLEGTTPDNLAQRVSELCG